MIGLKQGTVRLEPYNPVWEWLYYQEKNLLCSVIGTSIVNIEHIGSTAVPGISAKPIIDIMIGIKSFEDGLNLIRPLEKIAYEYAGEHGIPHRHFFEKGVPRTHHLHVVAIGSDFWNRILLFRDFMRNNPFWAHEYNDLKTRLAKKFSNSRKSYTEAKDPFIKQVLKLAGVKA